MLRLLGSKNNLERQGADNLAIDVERKSVNALFIKHQTGEGVDNFVGDIFVRQRINLRHRGSTEKVAVWVHDLELILEADFAASQLRESVNQWELRRESRSDNSTMNVDAGNSVSSQHILQYEFAEQFQSTVVCHSLHFLLVLGRLLYQRKKFCSEQ